ncbi:MAG: YraN family protein [Candidatus Veblenbacteria bacterium]|nr:YraN family protein [Candidatus Veblenbacteria bacterium]MDZ4229522.1 YraN family protein [Candidatus Veblenbacteria bacterium]
MPHARQKTGGLGEAAARSYLEERGYVVLAQNWHAGRWGEIDIVAQEGNELIFVEVKTRRGAGFGYPEEAVNRAKQAKLRGAAQAYLTAHPHLPQQPRFDVVAIVLSERGEVEDIKHFRCLTFS